MGSIRAATSPRDIGQHLEPWMRGLSRVRGLRLAGDAATRRRCCRVRGLRLAGDAAAAKPDVDNDGDEQRHNKANRCAVASATAVPMETSKAQQVAATACQADFVAKSIEEPNQATKTKTKRLR